MELTVDQALQQGVAAHKEGKLQEAERVYRAILQVQPNHPDANHNLGGLTVAVGKPYDAIPLLKLALKVNPKIEQYWLTYIGVLMKLERFDEAVRALLESEKSGVSSDKLDALKKRLRVIKSHDTNATAETQTLSEQTKAKGNSSATAPSQDQIHRLAEHYRAGRLEEAEALATSLTQQFPKHPVGWKILGVVVRKAGRLAESLALLQSAVGLSLQDAAAHNNLGITLQELGRLDEAEASYRQAIALEPDYAEAHNNLGNTLKKMARLDETEASYRQAVAFKPDLTEAHYNLGITLQELGKLVEAEASYRQAMALKPDYAEANYNLGNTLKGLGKLDEAELSYRQALALKPDYVEAHCNLGITLQELGRAVEAEANYRQAIALRPNYAEAHYNSGITLAKLGRAVEAEASYRQAIALRPDYAEAHCNLGNTLKELGRLDGSEASYKRAIAVKPDFAEAHSNLGNTLLELGELDEAIASYSDAIALQPDYAEAYRNLTTAKTFSSKDEQFFQMQALYRNPAISETNRCHICFALAKASEDLGDCAAAFRFYAEGNALRKKQLGYDKAQDKQLFEKLKESQPRITAHPLESEITVSEHTPIFIVGMPRSGTTLVEQIISSHPLVTGAGELPFVSQFGHPLAANQTLIDGKALAIFREQYLTALQLRSDGKAIVTDKMPHNFRLLGLIATALPNAKIIHVKRDPAAVCWANYTQYFVSDSLGYCYDLDDVLHYHELYQDLMRFWHQALPHRIYDLNYEVLTEDQEEQTRKLIEHLRLEWNDACLSPQENDRGVATASNVQVRQKVYQRSSERWKRYKPYLNGALDRFGLDQQ